MRRIVVLLIAALLVALPAQAGAHVEDQRYLAGARISLDVWGPPACGTPHIHRAWWGSDSGTLGMATSDWCLIQVRAGLSGDVLCHVVVHEWGHLAGRGHSSDRYSVMYYAYWGHTYWRCRGLGGSVFGWGYV